MLNVSIYTKQYDTMFQRAFTKMYIDTVYGIHVLITVNPVFYVKQSKHVYLYMYQQFKKKTEELKTN